MKTSTSILGAVLLMGIAACTEPANSEADEQSTSEAAPTSVVEASAKEGEEVVRPAKTLVVQNADVERAVSAPPIPALPASKALVVEVDPGAGELGPPALISESTLLAALGAGQDKTVLISSASLRSSIELLMPGAPDNVRRQFGRASSSFASEEIREANAIWLDSRFSARDSYLSEVNERAHLSQFDFATLGPTPINDWVASVTDGKIKSLLSDLAPSAEMVATNALLFKGLWQDAFDPQRTEAGVFVAAGGAEIPAQFMTGDDRAVMRFGGNVAVRLATKGGAELVFMLPDEGLSAMEASSALNLAALSSEDAFDDSAALRLPKFSLESKQSMNDALRLSGFGYVLDAAYTGISESGPRISDIFQKVKVEIDEAGASAAAATAVILNRSLSIEPELVSFERPFWFAITAPRADASGDRTILFSGFVASPAQDGGSHEKL